MALNIKDDRTHALARRLADATGQSLTEAVRGAIEERLARVEQREKREHGSRLARLNAIALAYAALPQSDDRTPDEIVGYDEHGMW